MIGFPKVVATCLVMSIVMIGQTTAAATCPDGWEFYAASQKCYKAFNIHLTHADARAECKKLGGDLATIRNAGEQSFIEGLVDADPMDFHIGLTDIAQEGSFRWLDENTETTYTNWYYGQPDNAWGNENCATVWGYLKIYERKWVDQNCDTHEPYMCEILL